MLNTIKEEDNMALKKKPVTGMKDILPKEMEIRNYVMNMIRETYGTFGFSSIDSVCGAHRKPDQQTGRRQREADLQDLKARRKIKP